jgi:Tfp pilus assembly protein PilV
MTRSAERGQTLIEVLAALVLFAMAGAVIASAATTNLRSLRAAGVRGRLVALAAREMARLQVTAVPGTRTEPFTDGAMRGTITGRTAVNEEGTLATLTATVAAAPPGPQVRLVTRVRLPW